MILNFIGPQQKGINVVVENQITKNLYLVRSSNSSTGFALVSCPGTVKEADVVGACRGLRVMSNVLYGVFGSTLYSFNSAFAATSLGAITGSSRVGMADDGTNLVIVTGTGNPGYVYAGLVLNSITDPDFTGADTVAETAGYFLFTRNDGEWFICVLGDPTDYSALDFATNDKAPDDVLAIIEDHGEAFCFGETTIQVWFNSGNADFPFELNTSAQIERGTYARWSACKDDNTIFFLGDDLVAYRLNGYTPTRISDFGVEAALSAYRKDGHESDLKNAFGYTYTEDGHKFYVLTVPNRGTHVFDVSINEWHTRKHWDYQTHHSAHYVKIYGKHIVAGVDGNLYRFSDTAYDDDGAVLERERQCSVISMDDRRLRYKEIKFIVDAGQGLATGQGSDPVMMVKWSSDSGRTFKNERFLELGVMGDYTKKVVTRHCGSDRRRQINIRVTDPVSFTILEATAAVS